jgi:hypothetical protein
MNCVGANRKRPCTLSLCLILTTYFHNHSEYCLYHQPPIDFGASRGRQANPYPLPCDCNINRHLNSGSSSTLLVVQIVVLMPHLEVEYLSL